MPPRILRAYADPAHIFVVAEQFRNAATWMMTTRDKWPADMQIVPATCAAFALELYFKCLLSSEMKAADRTHKLRSLFDQLEKPTQKEIRANTDLTLMVIGINVIHDAWRRAKKKGPPPAVDFDFLLDASDDAFNITRYIHESGLPGGKGWVGDPILNAARATILKRHPKWAKARQASPKIVFT